MITPRGNFNVYSLIIMQQHFDAISTEYIQTAPNNLKIALMRENILEFCDIFL